ncbi:MAG: tRNA preQ1(34) S-adenosylmethionine ribosyltransferase-isomerase QueA [Syntrophaceae bacterium]|nr:tRNA preQ1(34) S-adenosylmethionine ribosyltransferase-isomerase QueA [Syntrophaceae bacterium]
MKPSDFDYRLPSGLIAQRPPARRGDSRLMVVNRERVSWEHRSFFHLPEYLNPGDALVLNDTKVIPARLIGQKESGGKVEVLLVRKKWGPPNISNSQEWECLAQSTGRLREKTRVFFEEGVGGEFRGRTPEGLWNLSLESSGVKDLDLALKRIGFAPLPPYIRRNGDGGTREEDRERYQTVYARREGAIAAPTAGMHFTEEALQEIRAKGVSVSFLTLHVGMGTFLPVKSEEVEEHRLEPEFFDLPPETAAAINDARKAGGRVLAVGTTVTRVLESSVEDSGKVRAHQGMTGLFILPGHRFRAVDALLTNFHLPRSTILMLVSAFAGREFILSAYEEAVRQGYRFYSYGDAMLIL